MPLRYLNPMLCCLLALCACTPSQTPKELIATMDVNGYWACERYIDGLVKEKRITEQLICPITWNNLVFEIKDKQLVRHGLMHNADTIALEQDHDTLGVLEGFGNYTLRCNPETIKLHMLSNDPNTGACPVTNVFRRINAEEFKAVRELLQTYSLNGSSPF